MYYNYHANKIIKLRRLLPGRNLQLLDRNSDINFIIISIDNEITTINRELFRKASLEELAERLK